MRLLSRRILLVSAVLALEFAGCGDDPSTPGPTTGAVEGGITTFEGDPLAGVGVILVDPNTVATVSAMGRTDAAGRYRIDHVAAGDYAAFVVDSGRFANFVRTTQGVHVVAGQTAIYHIQLIASGLWSDRPPRIKGTVRDGVSNAPVAGAHVSGIFSAGQEHYAFGDITAPPWTVTDSAGQFTMLSSVFTDERGQPLGLEPISDTKSGFEPATLVGRGDDLFGFGPPLPLPTPPDSDLVVVVRLRGVVAGAPAGAIAGQVALAGTPVMGVRVALALQGVADPDTIPGPVLASNGPDDGIQAWVPGKVAVTDAGGRFLIAGLHPGRYVVHAAYPQGDGYAGVGGNAVPVAAAETTQVGTVAVLAAMTPVAPLPGSYVAPHAPIVLSWNPPALPPGTHLRHYRVEFGPGYLLQYSVSTTSPTLTIGALDYFTPIRWFVSATLTVDASGDSLRGGAFEFAPAFSTGGPPR